MTTITKRLTIDLSEGDHKRLKLMSSIEGVSMKEFLLSRAFENKSEETEYLLKGENKARILKALSSKKGKTFDSLKDIKNAIGI